MKKTKKFSDLNLSKDRRSAVKAREKELNLADYYKGQYEALLVQFQEKERLYKFALEEVERYKFAKRNKVVERLEQIISDIHTWLKSKLQKQ